MKRRVLHPCRVAAIGANPITRLFEKRDEIEAVCLAVKSTRVVPPGAHDDVGTGVMPLPSLTQEAAAELFRHGLDDRQALLLVTTVEEAKENVVLP